MCAAKDAMQAVPGMQQLGLWHQRTLLCSSQCSSLSFFGNTLSRSCGHHRRIVFIQQRQGVNLLAAQEMEGPCYAHPG